MECTCYADKTLGCWNCAVKCIDLMMPSLTRNCDSSRCTIRSLLAKPYDCRLFLMTCSVFCRPISANSFSLRSLHSSHTREFARTSLPCCALALLKASIGFCLWHRLLAQVHIPTLRPPVQQSLQRISTKALSASHILAVKNLKPFSF